jgi:hypothetical protein
MARSAAPVPAKPRTMSRRKTSAESVRVRSSNRLLSKTVSLLIDKTAGLFETG